MIVCARVKEVAAKVIDGEAIIINLANGIYYSMDKVGALIWEMLAAGHSLAEVTTAVLARYDTTREQAETDAQKLAAELVREHLLVISQDTPAFLNGGTGEPSQKLPYEVPQLHIYRDMGDLLSLYENS